MLEKVFIDSFKDLINYINEKRLYSFKERGKIKEAYNLANEKHKGIKRDSGEPYIVHPLNVAKILVEIDASADVVQAGLLHDVLEDTDTTYSEIKDKFGKNVADLVDAVTKVSTKMKNFPYENKQDSFNTIIKIVDSFQSVSIKLADKLHNMRTIEFKPPHKQIKTAKECLELFVPIAYSSGIYFIKTELENICLSVLDQPQYDFILSYIQKEEEKNELYLSKVMDDLRFKITNAKIKIHSIVKRIKEPYSIYKKMNDKNKQISELYDILGIRIIVKDEINCFMLSSLISKTYVTLPEKYKDYITHQKENGYQSIHHIINVNRVFIEVQIRSVEMHRIAEYGSASHFSYKTQVIKQNQNSNHFSITEIMDDKIKVFTPKKDFISLPRGANCIDFAYSIDENIGNHILAAKINGKFSEPTTSLLDGDTVEIINGPDGYPKLFWIKSTKTTKAQEAIKRYITEHPRQLFSIKAKEEEIKKRLEKINYDPDKLSGLHKYINIEGNSNIHCHLAKCCKILIGDEDIIGVVSRNGISIHKLTCKNIQEYINKKNDRLLEVSWDFQADSYIYRFMMTILKGNSDVIEELKQNSEGGKKYSIKESHINKNIYNQDNDNTSSLDMLEVIFQIKGKQQLLDLKNQLSSMESILSFEEEKVSSHA